MNEIKIFENLEFGKIRTIIIGDKPWLFGKDVAEALGYSNTRDALISHVDKDDKNTVAIPDGKRGNPNQTIINESGLYSLIFGSKLPSANKFKRWVTNEVLPSIRKTGGYVSNDDLFIDTYLPFADMQTKLLFTTTLETIRTQNNLIKNQQDEIVHKQEVINGLTDNIDIYKKKDIINRICRRKHDNYANRYKELYKCFRENFHIDLEARCEGYNLKQLKKKDRLSVIKYAEQFGYIDDLYSCCVKLYEAEVKEILEELNELRV